MSASHPPVGLLPVASKVQTRRAAWNLVRNDWPALVVVVTLYGLSAAAGLAGPWLVGEIVDRVREGAGVSTVDRLALAIAGFVLLQLLLERFARYAGYRFGERALARLREQFVDRVTVLPPSVVERAGGGDLMARSTGDLTTLGPVVRDAAPEIFLASTQVVFILGAVFFVDPRLGLCALLGVPLLVPLLRWYLRRAQPAYLAEGAADSALSEELAATVEGARTVEAFRLGQRRIDTGDAEVSAALATRRRTLFLRSIFLPGLEVSYTLPLAGTTVIGGSLFLAGVVSLGSVVSAILYIQRMLEPLNVVLTWIEQLQRGRASLARVVGVSLVPPDRTPGRTVPTDNQVEVTGVHFAYRGDHDVLHGIDLSLRPGERIAIVGPSGAGKSTLGRLLAGVDPPRIGQVAIGGSPVTELPLEELRRRVVLVTQDHHIFIGTVRENLLFAKPSADDDELRAALAAACADWLASLPDGLDTVLGSGGLALEPGQAQQLALARLTLADPRILVLDEATSLLDPTSARRTERALATALAGRTVVAIAHRLHPAHDADRVVVLQDGRIRELGSHRELIAASGSYASLWRAWHGAAG